VAEFNVSFDSISAKIVLESGANIAVVPLDITQSFVFSMHDLERITKAINSKPKIQQFLTKLTEFEINTTTRYRETSYQEGFFIHDAHTV
jgi:inosine-uridine nucleoside N-ribohydrolase